MDSQPTQTTSLQNEAILNLFYDLPFIGMAITSPETQRWLKFNDRLCEIYGYSREELPHIAWTEITHPDDLELDLAEYAKVMRGESDGYVMDKRFIRKDGQIIYASINVKSVRKADGKVDFFVATVQDISDRKNAENALQKLNEELERRIEERTADLKRSEARNLAILQSLPDLMLLLKPDGTCIDCIMPSTFDTAKYIPIQKHISEVLSPETLATQLKIYEKAIATGEVQIYEHMLTKFGKTVHEEVRITPYSSDELLVIVRDISDRKHAEELLRKSDAHLKTAQRISKLGSWEFDLLTGNVIWSEEVFRIFGRDPKIGTPTYSELQNYVHPDDWEYFSQVVEQAIATAKSYDVDYRVCWADGTLRNISARGEIICDPMGQPIQIIGTVIDITNRKQAEQQLLKSDTHLKVAQRIGKIGSWEFEINTGHLTWSDEIFRIYGLEPSPSPPDYDDLQKLIYPDDWEHFDRTVQNAITLAQPYDLEHRVIQPNGTLIHVLARGEMIYDSSGMLTHIIGTAMDISDRKLAEQQLQDLSDRLTLAVKSAAIGIWEWDIVNNCLFWDERTYELYGITPDPTIDAYLAWANRVHPSDLPSAETAVQMALSGEKDYETEFRIILPDDNIRYLKVYGLVQRNQAGETQRLIGVNFDVTAQKLAEAKILETAHQLANTNRELESFSYSVSHDLRAPLRHMSGFASALQQQLKKHEAINDPKVTHYLEVVAASSKKMGDLIDGLLTLSRYGRRSLEAKPLSIRELVNEAIEIIHGDPSYNPLVEFAIGDLPMAIGDRTLLQQVFRNLIGNAVKFSRNHPHPRIEIDSLPDGTIRIKDNGAGFQMEYADKLFGAFQRLHNDKEFEGTGIGLAIVQRIIQRHGGSIWAEGYPNQGATFFLKI